MLVEEPSYLAALQAFALAGARVVPVACDDEGLDPDAVAAAAAEHRAAAALHDPDVPEPDRPDARRSTAGGRSRRSPSATGSGCSRTTRTASCATAASRCRAWRRCAEDRTLALSTLSKVAAPGLRIGWVRTPPALRPSLVVAKQAADLHSSTIDQAAAAHWLATVDLDAHVASPARGLRRAPRRAARRARRRAAAGLDPQPPRRRHVRLGAAPGRLGRRGAAAARAGARRGVRPRLSVLRRRARPGDAAASPSPPTRRRRSPRGWRGCGGPGTSLCGP